MKESNINALRSSLFIIEKRLNQITSELGREFLDGGSSASDSEIDVMDASKVHEVVASMLEEVSCIKRKYQLEEKNSSARASIMGMVIELDLLLDDLMPERLRAYGELDNQDSEYLTSKIIKMKSMVSEIYKILHYVA